MTARLFVPPGPAVTPTESAHRRAVHNAAQTVLPLGDTPTGDPSPCPVCAGTHRGLCPRGVALTLTGDP